MAQPEFLIRESRDTLRQATEFRAYREYVHKVVGKLGPFVQTERTDKVIPNRISVAAGGEGRDVILPDGRKGHTVRAFIEHTAAGAKKAVRRLRPEEAAVLDDIDAQIADLTAQIKALRARRVEVVKDAWTKAHVVRLQEVDARIYDPKASQ